MPEIKLATAAWGFREMELPEYFTAAKEMQIDYVEVNLGPNSPGHLQFDASDADLDRALQAAEDAGVEIVALAGGNNFAAPTSTRRSRRSTRRSTCARPSARRCCASSRGG
jgi:sugar phosphate isomerase/epimerase